MAHSIAKGAAVAVGLLLMQGASAGPQIDADQPIELEARSSDFDYASSALLFRAVRITQGSLSIEADEATANGLDFKSSAWHFSGHVQIHFPDGQLLSSDAKIQFTANQIAMVDVIGGPAAFEQRRASGLARGHANRIEYEPTPGMVHLTGDAWLSDGSSEMTGNVLVYDLINRRVVANPGDQADQHVHLTIQPRKHNEAASSPTSPATPPPAPIKQNP